MSLLSLIGQACGELGITIPTSVVGSSDPQVQQLYALANKAGRNIAQANDWQALIIEKTFVTTATTVQVGAIATDLDRFIPNTFNNRTTRRPIIGPVTPQQWQWLIAQPAYSTVYLMYRERDDTFMIGPPTVAPPAGQTIAYEYVSDKWARSLAGVAQTSFLADTDTTYLDEFLISDSIIWQFKRAKGLSYAEEMRTFERNLEQQSARDGGSTRLQLSPSAIDLNRINLPDGSFPSA